METAKKWLVTSVLLFCLGTVVFTGCSGTTILKPSGVDDSLVGTVVTVKGSVTFAVEDPMGVGGLYMTLGDDDGTVDVRIQEELWDSYSKIKQNDFRQGETVTVEGLLVRAGEALVVVHGKYEYDTPPDSADE